MTVERYTIELDEEDMGALLLMVQFRRSQNGAAERQLWQRCEDALVTAISEMEIER